MPFDNTPLEAPLPPVNGGRLRLLLLLAIAFGTLCVSRGFTYRSLAHSGGAESCLMTKYRGLHRRPFRATTPLDPKRRLPMQGCSSSDSPHLLMKRPLLRLSMPEFGTT
jgi:hypothetical protein